MDVKLREAQEILDVMLKYMSGKKQGRPSAFVVVDGTASRVCLARIDGSPSLSVRMCENKAYTAIDWGRDTKEVRETLFRGLAPAGEPVRDIAWFGDPRYAPIWGGVLLKNKDGRIVGAIGTSGLTMEEDEELAQVGAKCWQDILMRRGGK
jgi:uncharacterized protein GlcG (DUF336 family)